MRKASFSAVRLSAIELAIGIALLPLCLMVPVSNIVPRPDNRTDIVVQSHLLSRGSYL